MPVVVGRVSRLNGLTGAVMTEFLIGVSSEWMCQTDIHTFRTAISSRSCC